MSIATFYTAVVNDTTSTIHGVTVYFWATGPRLHRYGAGLFEWG